jgi:hypothetical protein
MRTAVAKFVLTILTLCIGFAVAPLEAGFRSPETIDFRFIDDMP